MISKGAEFSEYLKQNYKCKPQDLLRRKLKYGVGLNDSDYLTQPSIGGARVRCPAYSAWCEVIKRGYCSKYKAKYPTYEGVVVCNNWLEFSNFREWFINNHIDSYELDKDLLFVGNRVYSPKFCVFVPNWVNAFTTDCSANRGDYKIGVHWDISNNSFRSRCSNPKTKKREHLGLFKTEHEAYNAWLKRKLELALELKPEMDIIDLRIYTNIVEIIKSAN